MKNFKLSEFVSPIEILFDTNTTSNKTFNDKTKKALNQIISIFDLSTSKINEINSFLAENKFHSEKGLEDYIEMILTDKAKK